MKLKNILTGSLAGVLLLGSLSACTDLTETVYDQIMSTNYYNTKDDIIKATFRPLRTWVLHIRVWDVESQYG